MKIPDSFSQLPPLPTPQDVLRSQWAEQAQEEIDGFTQELEHLSLQCISLQRDAENLRQTIVNIPERNIEAAQIQLSLYKSRINELTKSIEEIFAIHDLLRFHRKPMAQA